MLELEPEQDFMAQQLFGHPAVVEGGGSDPESAVERSRCRSALPSRVAPPGRRAGGDGLSLGEFEGMQRAQAFLACRFPG